MSLDKPCSIRHLTSPKFHEDKSEEDCLNQLETLILNKYEGFNNFYSKIRETDEEDIVKCECDFILEDEDRVKFRIEFKSKEAMEKIYTIASNCEDDTIIEKDDERTALNIIVRQDV